MEKVVEVVIQAIRNDGYCLEYVSDEFKKDIEVVVTAVKHPSSNEKVFYKRVMMNRQGIEKVQLQWEAVEQMEDSLLHVRKLIEKLL